MCLVLCAKAARLPNEAPGRARSWPRTEVSPAGRGSTHPDPVLFAPVAALGHRPPWLALRPSPHPVRGTAGRASCAAAPFWAQP